MNVNKSAAICPICNSLMNHEFKAEILHKYKVNYYKCSGCGIFKTEKPYWLEEAYKETIAKADTGLLSRNYTFATTMSVLLYFLFPRNSTFLDLAGGFGIFTRLMRDNGFDYYWDDKFCPNLVAKGFEFSSSKKKIDAISAFEVLEHIYLPIEFLQEQIEKHQCDTFFFTTETYKNSTPEKNWWYYTFETGQHITFYKSDTLRIIALKLQLNYYSIRNIHILTSRKIYAIPLLWIATGSFSKFLSKFIKWRLGSFTEKDHIAMLKNQSEL